MGVIEISRVVVLSGVAFVVVVAVLSLTVGPLQGGVTCCEGFDFGAPPGPAEGFARVVLLTRAAQ